MLDHLDNLCHPRGCSHSTVLLCWLRGLSSIHVWLRVPRVWIRLPNGLCLQEMRQDYNAIKHEYPRPEMRLLPSCHLSA